MAGVGNRYSMDSSYDMPKNYDFPIEGDLLWPSGKLLQLQEFRFSSDFREKHHIIFLFPRQIVIAEQTESEKNVPWGFQDAGELYRYYTGGTRNEQAYGALDIARVELGLSTITTYVGIWISDSRGKNKRVFRAYGMGTPNSFVDLAERSVHQGIGRLRSDGLVKVRGINEYRNQLLHREIEQQFRRAAPQAEIVLKGEQMSPEDFHRVVG